MDEIFREQEGVTPTALINAEKDKRTLEMSLFTVPIWSGRRFIGSGTLVTAGGNYGVLTAHHVSDNWNHSEP